jgi:hypothetical protein
MSGWRAPWDEARANAGTNVRSHAGRQVCKWPILLKKSFAANMPIFLGLVVRFARLDVGVHVELGKIARQGFSC